MTRVTRINRMVMRGFKSFNQNTELKFGEGFNCVLGPNGAGKSNVFDSLIFVLGKSGSKGMRAEKTANLIYNGGKSKQPAKTGMVAIYFDNSNDVFGTGNPELEIKRVVKNDGSSKYMIDGETRTRTQLLDILSRAKIDPDSHNIILQGDIVHLVEMSPVERRGMVEEIAGITIYEDKKEKALRELTRVEEKLNEADIILTERKSYLKELKKERDQALKFKELDEKIKRNKATLLHLKIKDKNSEIDACQKKITENKKKLENYQKDIEGIQDKISKKKDEVEKINSEIEEKGEKEQVAMHKEVEQLRVDLALKEQRMETVRQEIDKLSTRKEELDQSFKEIGEKIESLEKEKKSSQELMAKKEKTIKELDEKINSYREKNKLEDAETVDKRIEQIDADAEEVQSHIQKLREDQQKLLREKDTLEVQLQNIDNKIDKVLELEKENKEVVDKLKKDKARFKTLSGDLNDNLTRNSEIAVELDTARGRLNSKREELSKLKAQSASIREGIAGDNAVSAILAKKNEWKGIHGTVAELGKVNSEYALALEIAAGARMRSIVVENDEVAAKCIKYLKENKAGVATFLPLNKIKSALIKAEVRNMKGAGIEGLAIDLVEYSNKFDKVFKYVFGNTLVVDKISSARKIGVGTTRMVTLDGDVVETSGAMQGGHRIKNRRGLGFRDKEVSGNILKLEHEIDDLEAVVEKLVDEKNQCDDLIEKLRSEKAEVEGDIIKAEKSLHLDSEDLDASKDKKKKLADEIKVIEDQLTDVQADISKRNKELANLKIERQKLREQLSNLRNPAILAELNSFTEKKNETRSEIAEMKGELKGFDSELQNILLPERDSIQKILKQHEKEAKEFEEEKKSLEKEVKAKTKELKEMEEKEKKFYSQFKGLFDKRQTLGEEIKGLESQILSKNEKVREIELKNNEVSLDNARLKAQLSGLEEENKEYENVSVYRNKDEDQIKKEVDEFEKMASGIGAVNMKALEIYDQVEHEYEKLLEKKDKLNSEREDVLVMINKIDTRKKELFMKTYESLNRNFKRIFGNLSTKGEAGLELEDEKDPFNGGVNIRVKLSGKKFLDIRSLSGGEKTLTALAFIFAVQEYEPAPFYILDEVDAALDKRNSEKLAKLISSYCGRAQYIIISHNDSVIGNADNLYGVSMNEHGESKVTSLKV